MIIFIMFKFMKIVPQDGLLRLPGNRLGVLRQGNIRIELLLFPCSRENEAHGRFLREQAHSLANITIEDIIGDDYRPGEAVPWGVDETPDTAVVQAIVGTQAHLFKVRAPGKHFALNALGALAVVEAMGADVARACVDLAEWSAVAGRGARETIYVDRNDKTKTLTLIDDAYNANPASTAAALAVLTEASVSPDTRAANPRRIAILGDMKELGPTEAQMHADLAQLPAVTAIDSVFCVGPLMRHLFRALPAEKQGLWAESSSDMTMVLGDKFQPGDVVLVKGSLSMGMARIVDALRKMGHAAPQHNE